MSYHFSKEDIMNYAEGGLSQDTACEIKSHIDKCEECRRFYGVITLSESFASKEISKERNFYEKVMRNIDSDRYAKRKTRYVFGQTLTKIRPFMKPVFAVAAVCIVLLVAAAVKPGIGNYFSSDSGNKILAGNTINEGQVNEPIFSPTPRVTQADSEAMRSSQPQATGIPAENRPETKEMATIIEGTNENYRFKLIDNDTLGFSTYIPDKFEAESLSTNFIERLTVYVNYTGKVNKDAFIQFSSPPSWQTDKITFEGLLDSTEDNMKSEGFTVRTIKDNETKFYKHSEVELWGEKKDSRYGSIISMSSLFKHGDRPYRITVQYPIEYAEGFVPRVNNILNEIVWNE